MAESKIVQTEDKLDSKYRHVAAYSVNDERFVTVTYLGKFRTEGTQQGGLTPETTALQLLSEIVKKLSG